MKSAAAVLAAMLMAGAPSGCTTQVVTPGVDAGGATADLGGAGNVAGKHVHMLTVEGVQREVIVHVPVKVAGNVAAPVVLMFHGTSGDGEKFYNISGWKEKANVEGLIAVFPSALTYCLKEDENHDGDFDDPGERKVTTKWAAGELGSATMPLCSTSELDALSPTNRALCDHPLKDDVAYVMAILDLLKASYVVDDKRVYPTGFSNGAGFTQRLALEKSDRFAAVAAASGPLVLPPQPTARPLSMLMSLGTHEDSVKLLGVTELPLDTNLFTTYPLLYDHSVGPTLSMLQLTGPHTYEEQTVAGRKIGHFTWVTSSVGASNRLHFLEIEGQTHEYPNGTNHPVVLVDLLWDFFKAEHLP